MAFFTLPKTRQPRRTEKKKGSSRPPLHAPEVIRFTTAPKACTRCHHSLLIEHQEILADPSAIERGIYWLCPACNHHHWGPGHNNIYQPIRTLQAAD